MLLQCASPDAIARLKATELRHDAEKLWNMYFKIQKHGSLSDYLQGAFTGNDIQDCEGSLVQVTKYRPFIFVHVCSCIFLVFQYWWLDADFGKM